MNATKILWGQVLAVSTVVLGFVWAATEWTAWRLAFQPQLGQPWFELHHLWYTSVATVTLQAAASWWMLSVELRRKLTDDAAFGSPLPQLDAAAPL